MNYYEYEFRLSYLRELFKQISTKNFVLFGAGEHTKWILENFPKPSFILDEFCNKKSLKGVKVFHPENSPYPDLIIISSDTQEARLKERAEYYFPESTIIALYENIGIGPFSKKSYPDNDISESLKEWKNKYAGNRCFIIGNGPSINNMDLSNLKNEYTFGANRIYLLFKELGFETSFLSCVNPYVVEQFQDDFNELQCPKFFSSESSEKIKRIPPNTYFLPPQDPGTPCFHKDLTNGIWWGATITFVSMQLAFYMGFQEVYLIGVDHYFNDKGTPNKLVKFTSDDQNHFSPDYFKGYKWQLPDLETSEIAYGMAKIAFSKAGRVINDATVNGHLNAFEKVDYYSLFN